jgi:hypothetical protein
VYKATLIKALEVEIFTLPLDLYIEKLIAYIVVRIYTTKAFTRIKAANDYI